MRLAGAVAVPLIYGGLQLLPPRQSRTVLWRQVGNDPGETTPEPIGVNPGPGQRVVFDEGGEFRRDLQSVAFHPRHLCPTHIRMPPYATPP